MNPSALASEPIHGTESCRSLHYTPTSKYRCPGKNVQPLVQSSANIQQV